MKTVVITGSARGLGYEMAKEFKKNGVNVVLSDLDEEKLKKAQYKLEQLEGNASVVYAVSDVTNAKDIQNLIKVAKENFDKIDIWINNAGVNQPEKPIWELSEQEINTVLNVDLKATILGSKYALKEMINQKEGAIYNIEGYGSNDAKMLGLSIYGTSKRAVTYFTQALAKESKQMNTGVIVGRLSPGIMITEFISNALGNKEKIDLSENTKKIYNILGDYPDVVAKFLVGEILKNKENDIKIEWLTTKKAMWRFMTAIFNKRNFFDKSNVLGE